MAENNPLHLAVESGNYDAVCSLLEMGADINVNDSQGFSPLHKAAQFGHKTIVKLLIEKGADIDTYNYTDSVYPINLASKFGHLQIVELLIDSGSRTDYRSDNRTLSIHYAAEGGHINVIQYFLDNGIEVDVRNWYKRTPLHMAASRGWKDVVDFLLKKRANINLKDYFGNAPVNYAAQYGHKKVVELLLEEGATCKFSGTADGNDPLYRAVEGGQIEIIEYFLEKGANVHIQTKSGYTLLHAAARYGQTHLVQFLLDKGVDINIRTHSKGLTPLDYAARNCKSETIDFLIQKGATFETEVNGEYTILATISRALNKFGFCSSNQQTGIIESSKVIFKYILLHNSNIDHYLIVNYHSSQELTDFMNNCRKELEKMKCSIIGKTNISLYKFVKDMFDDTKLATYLCNENIRQELKNLPKYIEQFPIYGNINIMLENKIDRGMHRRHLIEEADMVLANIIPRLPVESRLEIFSYLSIIDLNNFIRSIRRPSQS